MSEQHSDIINNVVAVDGDELWIQGKVMIPGSESEEFKRVAVEIFVFQCPFRLYTFTFHLPDHLEEYLERFRRNHLTDARPFENFRVLIKQSFGMASRRLSRELQKTLRSMGSMVHNVQRAGGERESIQCGEAVLKKGSAWEGEGDNCCGAGCACRGKSCWTLLGAERRGFQ